MAILNTETGFRCQRCGACCRITDDKLCRINPVKPDKCRTFPF